MSNEHVEVLREMKGWRMPPIGGSAYNAALDAAIAALSAQQSGEWVLVPRQPTPEMVCAGFLSKPDDNGFVVGEPMDAPSMVWRAMLRAAPQPPAEAVGTVLGGEFHYLRVNHGLPDGTKLYTLPPPSAPEAQPVYVGVDLEGGWIRATAPPSAPVGVAADILRIVDTAIDVCNDRDRPAMAEDLEAVRLYVEQASAALDQQPAAVDDAMVERATMALLGKSHDTAPGIDWRCDRAWTVNKVRKHMRAALTAALAAQPGGSDNDR